MHWFERKQESVAASSLRAIQCDFVHFHDFCTEEQKRWLPTSINLLRRYVGRFQGRRSYGAIHRLVLYIREVNRAIGNEIDDPILDLELLELAAAAKQGEKPPIRYEIVREVTKTLGDGVHEAYARALLWVLYDSQFRISSLLNTKLEDLKVMRPSGVVWLPPPEKPVNWEEDGGFLPPSTACHLRDWFAAVGIVGGYLFPVVRNSEATEEKATPAHARQIVETALRSSEVRESVTFRAVRQGALADMFDAEVGLAKIMKRGGYMSIQSVKRSLRGTDRLDSGSLALAKHQDRWGKPGGY